MSFSLTEGTVERTAIEWFHSMGYSYVNGLSMAPGEACSERDSFKDVVLERRLRDAIERLNPQIPSEAREDAFRKVVLVEGPSLIAANQRFHSMLSEGVSVEYRRPDGSIAGDRVRLVDFANADMNDWLVVNQFTVIEGQHNRRPDIVVFLNGLPIAVIELKNAVDENASIRNAFKQLQTYKEQIPTLFRFNEFLVISDGLYARAGSLTANWEWFKVWRTIDGDTEAPAVSLELEVLMRGMFDRVRLLAMVRNFIAFEQDQKGRTTKILAGYHQFHAVEEAIKQTVRASKQGGDARVGVVWHTQGLSLPHFRGQVDYTASWQDCHRSSNVIGLTYPLVEWLR